MPDAKVFQDTRWPCGLCFHSAVFLDVSPEYPDGSDEEGHGQSDGEHFAEHDGPAAFCRQGGEEGVHPCQFAVNDMVNNEHQRTAPEHFFKRRKMAHQRTGIVAVNFLFVAFADRTDDGRFGIRFRRIPGKKSYARACGDDPSLVPVYASEFAMMCRRLHAVHVPASEFESVKVRYLRILAESPYFTPSEKEKVRKFIISAPDTDTAIHGDLQFGNAIFSGEERYFIDLGDFCYGHPYFDLGMLYLCCKLSSEDYNRGTFHMDNATASLFWDCFVQAGVP